jgi:endonuclease-8
VPEGDTVWRAAAALDRALGGRVLDRTDFRVPRYAALDLRGRTVAGAAAYGKHLFVRIEGGTSVHVHFKMEGEWRLYRRGRRWAGPAHEIRVVLSAKPWDAVGYRLQVLDLLDTAHERRITDPLGPDVLGSDWNSAEAAARLRSDPARPLAEALLDQRLVAGWGNVYKSEICFLSGLDPLTPVGEVEGLERVAALGHRLMAANRNRHGHVTTGDLGAGRGHWVYGRAGRPCRRCGTTIRREQPSRATQERVTYWCPHCQPVRRSARPARAEG